MKIKVTLPMGNIETYIADDALEIDDKPYVAYPKVDKPHCEVSFGINTVGEPIAIGGMWWRGQVPISFQSMANARFNFKLGAVWFADARALYLARTVRQAAAAAENDGDAAYARELREAAMRLAGPDEKS